MSNGNEKFTGVITALVTPFKKKKIDFLSLKRLLVQQLDGGVQGFVVNGTTAESPSLDAYEVEKIFKFVKKNVDGSVPLLLGTGTNSTKTTIAKTQLAKKWGADGALIVVPYYNKPTQNGIVLHYQSIIKAVHIPVILYNVPGRTVVSMTNETILRLAKNKKIVGVKEASGNILNNSRLIKKIPSNFRMLSGDDSTFVDFIFAGGDGVISVISHIIPEQARAICDAARRGDPQAKKQCKKYENLNKLLGVESNPIPVKMMLKMMGIIDSAELRLPLTTLDRKYLANVKRELLHLEII